ncbi:MAG: peptidase [Isosphaera sp.]|nr:peptidase [Isosphaera sp.]
MTRLRVLLLPLLLAGCQKKNTAPTPPGGPGPDDAATTLVEARRGFATKLARQVRAGEPVPAPPPHVFRKVTYDAPTGQLAAYLTPDPGDGKKRPAVVWVTGGDCNSIGDAAWSPAKASNDQSARQYREAGFVMMFPSLRGGNDNPGVQEGCYGEVDDVLAAADHLAKQPHVDPDRIYLGGHSTGGTLVLLVAASTDRFRAVFSFGPADTIAHYPPDFTAPVNTADRREVDLRSPGKWLHSVKCPTFVFEGAVDGNAADLRAMKGRSTNPRVQFFVVAGADHFSVLAPVNALIAAKIARDDGPETELSFTDAEVNWAVRK